MAKKNNNNVFKGLALAVGAGLVVNELTKDSTPRAANFTTASKTPTNDIYSIIEQIKQDPELMQMLRGSKGDIGDTGLTGAAGGNLNFSNSLVPNGALELGISSGWTGNFALGDPKDSLLSLVFTGGTAISQAFRLDYKKLYKYTYYYKNTVLSYYNVSVLAYDENENYLTTATYHASQPSQVVNEFTKMTRYLGGAGINGSFINPAATKFKIAAGDNSSDLTINRLILNEVSLGESVPSNLPFLPAGQEVYDSTTGDRGRYNGTTIDWYTML